MARPRKIEDDEVIERAMQAFWRQGWSATSIRDLERQLDLKAPSIYRRFGHKDGLARAVLERYLDRVIGRRIDRHLSGEGDPVANIRAFFESALQPSSTGQPPIGCLLTITATEFPTVSPELARPLTAGLAMIEDALGRELARAAADGLIDNGLDPVATATTLALSFQGLMVLARTGMPSGDLLGRADTVLTTILLTTTLVA